MQDNTVDLGLLAPKVYLRGIFAGCVFLLATNQSQAQNSPSLFEMGLDQLLELQVVTAASGFEQTLKDAPAAVTVIEAEEWQASGATTLTEAISRVAGLHIGMTQVGLGYEKPTIRGFSGTFGQQVLLLIDGLPFRSAREGSAPWAPFPLAGFKRIEIIRGSGSAIYGADAVGGIVNLVSYAPGEAPKQLHLGVGDNDYRDVSLTWGGKQGEHHWNVSFATQQADNDSARVVAVDAQSFYDTVSGTNASLAPGQLDTAYEVYSARAAWRFKNLSTSYMEWAAPDYYTGAGVSQSLDDEGNVKIRTQLWDVNFDASQYVPGQLNLRFAWHKFSVKANTVLFPPGARVPLDTQGNIQLPSMFGVFPDLRWVDFPDGVIGNPGSDSHTVSVQIEHVVDLSSKHKLRWALGAERSDIHPFETKNFGPGVYDGESLIVDGTLTDVTGTDYAYLPSIDRDVHFISVQDQWQFHPQWVATIGVRYDDYSDFGATTNPRLGLVWHPNKRVTFKAYTGTAFRAPSFVELYSRNNPAALGNTDLEPEQVDMLDTGVSATGLITEQLEMSLNLFHYTAEDLITYLPANNALVATNTGELKIRGAEYELRWHLPELASLTWNITALDPYDALSVDTSAIARLSSNLSLHLYRGPYHAFLGAEWAGERRRDDYDQRQDMDDNFTVDLKLEFKQSQWAVGLLAENLFDADVREPSTGFVVEDYPMARRTLKLQWTYNF